jgi:hypothetical protein
MYTKLLPSTVYFTRIWRKYLEKSTGVDWLAMELSSFCGTTFINMTLTPDIIS